MAPEVFEVKNMKTGIIHTVPEGHFSLTDPSYVLIQKPSEEKPVLLGETLLKEPLVPAEVPEKPKKPRGRPRKPATKASKTVDVDIED